jgi:hypothetical protein
MKLYLNNGIKHEKIAFFYSRLKIRDKEKLIEKKIFQVQYGLLTGHGDKLKNLLKTPCNSKSVCEQKRIRRLYFWLSDFLGK